MGEIVRKVKLCGIDVARGEMIGACSTVNAIIDTGATKSVISRAVAQKIAGAELLKLPIEGREVPTKLAAVHLKARRCKVRPLVVAVDDALVRRAGSAPDGSRIDMILGHDYLQAQKNATITFDQRRGDDVACDLPSKTPRRRARR